jgi:hypothetical protein
LTRIAGAAGFADFADTIHATTPKMKIHDIAEHLQRDLLDSPCLKIKKLRNGTQLKFVQRALGDWGYVLSAKQIHDLAAKAKSYDVFI